MQYVGDRPVAKGGGGIVAIGRPTALTGHFSPTLLMSTSGISSVYNIKLIKSSRLNVDSSFNHKVTSSIIIILKIEVSSNFQTL